MIINWHDKLTEMQRKFCEAYAANGGNALMAAKEAGYKQPHPQGAENIQKPTIIKALELLREETTSAAIATREERQEYWTSVMRDESQDIKDRLRASEILGRAQGDFIDRHHITGISTVNPEDLSDAELAQIAMADDTDSKRVH